MEKADNERTVASTPLGASYDGLAGERLLDRLLDERRLPTLEAVWRFGEPQLASQVVRHLALADDDGLSGLLLREVLDGNLAEPVPSQVVQRIAEHSPRLSIGDTDSLVDRLNNDEPLRGPFEPHRAVFEQWVLNQDGERADAFTLDVLRGEPRRTGDRAVQEAAHRRCKSDAALRRRASQMLREDLDRAPDIDPWVRASQFVAATHEGRESDSQLGSLVEALVRHIRDVPRVEFGSDTATAVHASSADVLREVLEKEDLPVQPSTISLAGVASSIPDKRRRPALFRILVCKQPHLWEQIWQQEISRWSPEEWDLRLRVVCELDADQAVPTLEALCARAPEATTQRLVQIAAQRGDSHPPLIATAATNVKARHDGGSLDTGQLWWPDQPRLAGCVRETLTQALPNETHAQLVAEAHSSGSIDATIAALLIPPSMVADLLGAAEPEQAEQLVRALVATYPEETELALRAHQTQSFSLECAAGGAPAAPRAAFAGAALAWKDLRSPERDRLLQLLELHALDEQGDLLNHIAGDTLMENAHRRAPAAIRLADLSPEASQVPDSILKMLESGKPELRTAASQAIAKICPQDADAVRAVRTIAVQSGVVGQTAQEALSHLSLSYISLMHDALDKDRRLEILELLGATAQPDAVDELLRHLGPNAVDDDPDVRRSAAKAVREASDSCEFSQHQHRLLGDLLDGEASEPDVVAGEDLSAAFARVSLGADAALQTLFDLVGFRPDVGPSRLFGDEKDRLVRHLQLYASEATRGDSGRPHRIMQLDLVAERLVRAAYVRIGGSEALKDAIKRSPTTPDYGELLQAMASVSDLTQIAGELRTLHKLRSQKTEYTHTGDMPSSDDEATARTCFTTAARVLLGTLTNAQADEH